MNKLVVWKHLSLLSFFLVLSGCGGGGGDVADIDICGIPTNIGTNSSAVGVLQQGDCLATDLDPDSGDNSFVDEYRITIPSSGELTITLRSENFDALLFLVDESMTCVGGCSVEQIIAFDDDSGGGVDELDAQITINLAAGTYLILANSYAEGESGQYTLTTSFF
ncbi:MAG TPA: hypothetical protein EYO59_04690 [Chromatiaceae bacterium]|nr:hypothetical protein [Chromatiaceae bacterium]